MTETEHPEQPTQTPQKKKRPFEPMFPRETPLPPVAVAANPTACESCRYWQRRGTTSFGACFRWQDVLVDSRDGVSAERFIPVTPELASCRQWDPAA